VEDTIIKGRDESQRRENPKNVDHPRKEVEEQEDKSIL